jgi:NADH-quinone oxidoreductase subunit E
VSNIQGRWMDTPLMGKPHASAPPLSQRFHEDAKKLIARYPQGQGRSALLPLLYLAQAEQGYVSATAMGEIGELLELTRAQVGAVSTFYTMFKRDPQGKWLVSVCTHPSCTLAGGDRLKARLEEELGIQCGQTTPDGHVSLEEVECLCACDGAPVFSVNYENYERLAVDDAVEMVKGLRDGRQPRAGARGDVPEEFGPVSHRMSGVEAPR